MKCGVGHYTLQLANALSMNRDVTVGILSNETAGKNDAQFTIEIIPVVKNWRLSETRAILSKIRDWRPDIVHLQFPTQGYQNAFLPWILAVFIQWMGIPLVQTWHEYFMKRCLLNALTTGGLIVVRPKYKEMMPAWFRYLIKHKLFKFIPNASSIPELKLTDEERRVVKKKYSRNNKQMIVYFGFAYPHKGVEFLFEIANPKRDHLVLVCDLDAKITYHRTLLEIIDDKKWKENVTVTGYLPEVEVGAVLSAADAVVLPFRDGAGHWNTSVHAAASQGTFVLTTSDESHGYIASENIFYAFRDDVSEMRLALDSHIGSRVASSEFKKGTDWTSISHAHLSFYKDVLNMAETQ
jgi:glycosyltransferase involved in cell wall biosynthesis